MDGTGKRENGNQQRAKNRQEEEPLRQNCNGFARMGKAVALAAPQGNLWHFSYKLSPLKKRARLRFLEEIAT
jgi:hypothetical protein